MKTTHKHLLLWLCLGLYPVFMNAQSPEARWEEWIEDLADQEEGGIDLESLIEELAFLREEPIDLNGATRDQLESLPFLTPLQVENILAYVYINGPMQTLYELQLIEEMDVQTVEHLLPFVTLRPVVPEDRFPSAKQIFRYGKHQLITRLDIPFYRRKGYEKNYLGTPCYHSLRYEFRYKDRLHVGMTAEKDAGEPMFALHNKQGYDHYSFYLLLKDIGPLNTLAVGNYRIGFGEGLIMGNGFLTGKSATLSGPDLRTAGIRKHSSTDEYNYLRGVATSIDWKNWTLTAFGSHRSLDAITQGDTLTSIQKTGLHRTEKEAERKGAAQLVVAGGNLRYTGSHYRIGATGMFYRFDRPYIHTLPEYARYNMVGQQFYNASIDYAVRYHRFFLSGESALGKRGNAFLHHLQYTSGSALRVRLTHRYYAHDYWAWFSRSFAEGSQVQNENGWYIATELSPWRGIRWFASADLFSFPWWKYRISKPSQGMDLWTRLTWEPTRKISMYVNYRYKRKERDVTGTKGEVILPTHHHRWRCRWNYQLLSFLGFRTTADYNRFHSQGEEVAKGYQFTQMVRGELPGSAIKWEVQGSYFHTDDHDSRVYISEKNLLYTFYTPSFSGRGWRWGIHLRWDFRKWGMMMAKWGQTRYADRDVIGSGNDQINGSVKSDLQLLMRLSW
ncbi:MAG: helix-hairpin-helix domain-containing protein [Bacteroides sp.]|nr:helix-hairpin-helix domain-containing protein [Bacteroides sp.]